MISTVNGVTKSIIKSLDSNLQSSYTKAVLAELRNSINRNENYASKTWQLLFEKLPKDFLNTNGYLTREERSILAVLQLYAVHQQGNLETVNYEQEEFIDTVGHFDVQYANKKFFVNYKVINADNETVTCNRSFEKYDELVNFMNEWNAQIPNKMPKPRKYSSNLGQSLNVFRSNLNDTTAIDNRFNTMLTASTYDELLNHLRHIIKIVKANKQVKINYPQLAKDMYNLLGSENSRNRIKLQWSQAYYHVDSKKENSNEK
ncbi:type I-E CRISPR-associated protein Cse2/CasB [Apilactobacillus xinyiensis]|uniref:type I-E CRISPR-associated protein Cse2/CasB n=1 Tax=Apilactobacillus xinyiensis TaxID=2841032 RepID=UPI001C7DD207|nr:type I-E CRISPR-associated protein Cse2/CasB [Apilactobacillus xinyiensis]MCL0319224.1 type I-E CRISPR-associated protein Cse2/CasB [Apilactobacillus xinyiensis]